MFDTDKEFEELWNTIVPWYVKIVGKKLAKRWFSEGAMKHYLRTSQHSGQKEGK